MEWVNYALPGIFSYSLLCKIITLQLLICFFVNIENIICDRILENHPYGPILHIKFLSLKSSLKICFFFINGSNTVKMLWITRKSVEIFKMWFCDVSKIVVNSKILFISGVPIRVIFQNLVTYRWISKVSLVQNIMNLTKFIEK